VFGYSKSSVFALAIAATAWPLWATPAFAQSEGRDGEDSIAQAEAGGIADIVVTATRRARRANDISITINAVSQERIADLRIETGVDLAKNTPGLFVSNAAAGQALQYSIRGVTQSDFSDILEGPIAVYFDDTYIPFLQGQVFGTFDLERIEVLKGPQGTQFGKNATGGLVHFIPAKPTQNLEGFASIQYGRFDKVRAEAAISGGLTESISARASFVLDRNDPYIENVFPSGDIGNAFPPLSPANGPIGEDQGFQETIGGRLQIMGEFDDRLTVRVTGSIVGTDMGTSPYTSRATTPIFNSAGQHINTVVNPPGVPDFIGTIPLTNTRLTSADFTKKDRNISDAYDMSGHIEYEFDKFTITSVSSYKYFKKDLVFDIDGTPANFVAGLSKNTSDSFSQEIRLSTSIGAADVIGGFFYVSSEGNLDAGFLAPAGSGFAGALASITNTPSLFGTGLDLLNKSRFKNTDYSGFIQADIPLAEKLTMSVGGRLIYTKQNFDFQSHGFQNTDDFQGETDTIVIPNWQPPFTDRRNKTLWSGKAVLEYRPNDDLLIYGGYNRGVKAGAYNSKFPDFTAPLSPAEIPFDEETLHAYEGGVKAQLFDRKLSLAGSVFYYDYKGYQTFTFTQGSGIIFNNDAETYGFELNADFLLGPNLRGVVSYAYTNVTVKDVTIAPALGSASDVVADVRPAFAPRHQASGNLVYTHPGDVIGGNVSVRIVGSYISDFFDNIRNFDSQRHSGYFLGDVGVKWASYSGLEFSIDVNNVFNKKFVESSFDVSTICGCSQTFYGKPSWWSFTVAQKF
jgi:iron complex outermembrane receptor protein